MAKEMMIIFVYDTQMLQKEEDDPSSAVLYFHPTWVSDQQKTALCGQLMGSVHCVKSILSAPKIVSLQSGKFYIKEYGRYLMAVGTDRNIADWLLEHRANTVSSLISFFHHDIVLMSKIYDNSTKLSAKLYHLFETYLKYLFIGGNIFSYIPSIRLPKSTSNVFLEALHILQYCQASNNVLGGTLLYHNKVVATQLSSDLTKSLVLADPYRIKCPAEIPVVNFDLPLGVQLLEVYVPSSEYHRLLEESTRSRDIFQSLSNKNIKMNLQSKPSVPKEPVLTAMKRDQSLIFTAVMEEDSDHHSDPLRCTEKVKVVPQTRPKFLNLKNKTTDMNIELKNMSRTKPIPNTPIGQVSSTPMTELNKVIHSKPLSICTNVDEHDCVDHIEEKSSKEEEKCAANFDSKLKLASTYLKIASNLHNLKKCSSVLDVRKKGIDEDSITADKKYYKNCKTDDVSASCIDENKNLCKTVVDPTYPIFKADGKAVSVSFYEDYVTNELRLISKESEDDKKMSLFKDFDWCRTDNFTTSKLASQKTDDPAPAVVTNNKRSSKEHRKSLTLPLKSLSMDLPDKLPSPDRKHSSGVYLTPLMSKLSSFTFDDKSSGFCSIDATPVKESRMFTPTQPNLPFHLFERRKSLQVKKAQNDRSLQKCILFVCGQKDMVLNLLVQAEGCSSAELIKKMWDICMDNLGKLEKQLHHCLETYPCTAMQNDADPYSFLYLDPEWDTVQRGGPWGSSELGALTYFHRDFKENKNLTEILMRCCDSVIYGYQCGKSEVFYHQSASTTAGLPTPADPMGTVPLKARRRLERDHSIILL